MEPNHVTAIIGVLLLTIAGVGGATIVEKPAGPRVTGHTYHLSFPLTDGSLSDKATVQDGASADIQLPLTEANLTLVVFAATWTDSPPSRFASAATVSISLSDPSGAQVGSGQGTDGTKGVAIPVGAPNAVPPEKNISASSEATAWDYVLVHFPANVTGTGNYKVTISCTRGGFHPLRDGSVSVNVEMVYKFYRADLKEVTK